MKMKHKALKEFKVGERIIEKGEILDKKLRKRELMFTEMCFDCDLNCREFLEITETKGLCITKAIENGKIEEGE